MSEGVKNNVKKYRVLADLNQAELADKVGVTRQTIIAIENGNHSPSILLCLKIADALNVTLNDLFYLEQL